MKANRAQIEKALDAPPADMRLFLLHGPDEAGSAALAKRLERAMGPQAERIDLDTSTLRNDPARLADEAASFSMFGDKRWVRVMTGSDDVLAAFQALFDLEQPGGNPVIALAGAKAGTKLLKIAHDRKDVLAFASYVPDAREADQMAVVIAREQGLRLSPDLARRISSAANGDRAVMGSEIEKLCLYLDAAPDRPAEATQEALDALSAETLEEDNDALVNAVLGGDLKALQQELGKRGAMGSSVGSIFWGLHRRATMIANIRADFDRSGQMDAAIEAARVFWKDKGAVQRQVRIWDGNGIARVIRRLGAAERMSRSSRNAGDVLVSQELLTIARQAARSRN